MEDRREARRRRRKRNQTVVYLLAALFILLIASGVFFGIRYTVAVMNQPTEEVLAPIEEEVVAAIPTVAPTPTIVEEEVDPLDELVDSVISNMTFEEKVAQLFMITPEALTGYSTVVRAGDSTKEALDQYAIGGLIYFSKNIQDEEQLTNMLENTVAYARYSPFIAVDEEGGSVARIANSTLSATSYEDMNVLGQTMMEAEAIAMGTTIGEYLSEYGFNLNLAPVADVLSDENSPLESRIFSSDPMVVASLASGVVTGLQSQEVSACMKHFPGLGGVEEDSHEFLPVTNSTLADMQSTDFLPFIAGIEAGVDMIMVGHIAAPEVTETMIPSSLSKVIVTDILREELGFEGVIITDSLQMKAITEDYSSAEAALEALLAGVDMILMPEDFEEAYQAVLDAVSDGTLTEERINESVHRILYAKYKYTDLAK